MSAVGCVGCGGPRKRGAFCERCAKALGAFGSVGFQKKLGSVASPKELPERLVAEPLEGWRVWKVLRRDTMPTALTVADIQAMSVAHDRGENPFAQLLFPHLSGIGYDFRWEGRDITATCTKADDRHYTQVRYGPPPPPHPAPATHCTCGVWALHEREDAERTILEYATKLAADGKAPLLSFVYGKVKLWGRIVNCERGYRAQHARPTELIVLSRDETLAAELGQRYGCEVRCELPRSLLKLRMEERKAGRKERARAREANLVDHHLQKHNKALQLQVALQSQVAFGYPNMPGGITSGIRKRGFLGFGKAT